MARGSRPVVEAAALALLLAPLAVHAQVTDVPDLDTATQTSDQTTATTDNTSAQSTNDDDETTTENTATTGQTTATDDSETSATSASFVATTTDGDSTSTFTGIDVPTIAGAGIPEIGVPWTAGASFQQKSSLPEGTVFIAIGAILAFLGACVLLWRGMVAWSINRSVKRAALASVGAGEKSTWGGGASSGYRSVSQNKASLYKDAGSSMSLDQLTSAGKPLNKPHFRDSTLERRETPPADLFFSPTAQANNRQSTLSHRNSAYMPSGYYASPNSAAAGGLGNTTMGGDGDHRHSHSIAPYANRSSYMGEPSPPGSPSLPPTRSSQGYRASREGLKAPPSREGRRSYLSAEPKSGHSSALYAQPSSSSLMVGSNSVSDLGGSRAPSAYLEDLFENHGNGPRERFQ